MREAVRTVIVLQLCITAGAGVVAALVGGAASGWSATIGGAVGVIPTLVYALTVSLVTGVNPARVVGIHLVAEFLKIATTLALFVVATVFMTGVRFVPLFATFCLTLVAYWGALYSMGRGDRHGRQ